MLVGCFELVQLGGDRLLVALDGGDATDDGVHVEELCVGGLSRRRSLCVGILCLDDRIFGGAALCGLLLALDEAQEVGLSAMEVGVLEVPYLGVGVALEDALLEVGDLVEAVHVELADEGGELLVLEPASEDLAGEALVVEHWGRIGKRGVERGGGDVPTKESPLSVHLIMSLLFGSFTILRGGGAEPPRRGALEREKDALVELLEELWHGLACGLCEVGSTWSVAAQSELCV